MSGLVLVAAFWLASLLSSYAVVEWAWPRDSEHALEGLERAAVVAVSAILVAIAANWLLSAARLLTIPGLWIVSILLGAVSTGWLARSGRLPRFALPSADAKVVDTRKAILLLVILTPLAVWVVYAAIRAWYLPVLNHDAIAYHLPKTVMIWWAKGARFFEAADGRISFLGSNYELLLADVMVATGSDRLTLLPSTFVFLAACAFAGAFARRWWGPGPHVVVAIAVTASAPVMLLQSVAHKNDIFVSALLLAALFGAARWLMRGERAGMVLAVASLAAALGTKMHAAFALGGLLIAIATLYGRIDRRVLRRDALALIGVSAIAFFALGGMTFVWNLIHDHSLTGHLNDPVFPPRWRRFVNVPLTIYLLVARAFDPVSHSVWIAWRGERWFAPRYEFYFSDVGVLVVAALVIAPFVAFRTRKDDDPTSRERRLIVRASVVGALLSLPLEMGPLGSCAAYFRYVVFALPPIAAYASGALARVSNTSIRELVAVASAVVLTVYAVLCGVKDRFAPGAYVVEATEKPTRVIPIWPNRPGSLVDLNAPKDAHVAVDADLDTWFYPAWGEGFTRHLSFIPPGPGPVIIPDDVQYVMIDRPWRVLFNASDPDVAHHVPGKPSRADTRVYHALIADPRFQLVWRGSVVQAVFVRRTMAAPATP